MGVLGDGTRRRSGVETHRHLVSNAVLSKDIAIDDVGLGDFSDVRDSAGHDCVAIICFAIFGKETNETLRRLS
jgi:hypothetical protein